jgi:hypothetical protein
MAVRFDGHLPGPKSPKHDGPRVTWDIDPNYKPSTGKGFDMAFELAEYNLGIGRFQRQPDNKEDYSSSDEPDMRPPDHPYVPLRARRPDPPKDV